MKPKPFSVLLCGLIAPVEIHGASSPTGNVAVWGQEVVPVVQSGTRFTKIAAEMGHHSLALKSDGTVVGWGYNYYGQARPRRPT